MHIYVHTCIKYQSMYDRFHLKRYTPKTHQIQILEFLGTNSDWTKIPIWICTARYRRIWVFRYGGFLWCCILSRIFHTQYEKRKKLPSFCNLSLTPTSIPLTPNTTQWERFFLAVWNAFTLYAHTHKGNITSCAEQKFLELAYKSLGLTLVLWPKPLHSKPLSISPHATHSATHTQTHTATRCNTPNSKTAPNTSACNIQCNTHAAHTATYTATSTAIHHLKTLQVPPLAHTLQQRLQHALQHSPKHTLQHTATPSNPKPPSVPPHAKHTATHTATHIRIHIATRCKAFQCKPILLSSSCNTYCNTHCNTHYHTDCNTLQHHPMLTDPTHHFTHFTRFTR